MSSKINDYCYHLSKMYIGDRGVATRPESGNDYIYSCGGMDYKSILNGHRGEVRGNVFVNKKV